MKKLFLLAFLFFSCTYSSGTFRGGTYKGAEFGKSVIFGTLRFELGGRLFFPGERVDIAGKKGIGFQDCIEKRWQGAAGKNAFLFTALPDDTYIFRNLDFTAADNGKGDGSVRFRFSLSSGGQKRIAVPAETIVYAGKLMLVFDLDGVAARRILQATGGAKDRLAAAVVTSGLYREKSSGLKRKCYFIRLDHPGLIGERRSLVSERAALRSVSPLVRDAALQRRLQDRSRVIADRILALEGR